MLIGLIIIIQIASLLLLYKFFYEIFKDKYIIRRLLTQNKEIKFDYKLEAKKLVKNSDKANKKGLIGKLEKNIIAAGLQTRLDKFFKIILAVDTILFILTYIITNSIFISVFSILITPMAFKIFLSYQKKKKLKKFSNQLLEITNFISSSIKSGYSLMQALNVVVQECTPPASTEFNQVLQDINIGNSYEEAFERLIERNPIVDLEIISTAILISRETGGNLGYVLDTVSNTIMEREKIIGEVKSLTAQGRISGLVITLLPIALLAFMSIASPSYISGFLTSSLGRMMLVIGACSQIIGGLFIKKITNINW